MISKQQQKYVQSLHNKKYRTEFKEFLVEGEKSVLELLKSDFKIKQLFCTEIFSQQLHGINANFPLFIGSNDEIQGISTLKTNHAAVAIVYQKDLRIFDIKNESIILLDNINDPGNLGTIIRLADWYGIKNIICSEQTVEFYNPKVISATMGSFTRVHCFYQNLEKFVNSTNLPIFGAFLEGMNIHQVKFEHPLALIIGSESHGIGSDLQKMIKNKITIPRFGNAESLNAGVATGIILDNIFRNK